jgi:hypothetical protein
MTVYGPRGLAVTRATTGTKKMTLTLVVAGV